MRWSIPKLLIGVLAAPLLFVSSAALAQSNPCGKFQFDQAGTLSCELVTTGGCDVQCVPPKFEIACDGACDVTADVGCTASCQTDCAVECNVNPGSFDCKAGCTASCESGCGTRCADARDKAYCESQCKAGCSADCGVECQATPPSATCTAKCEAACKGECHAYADIDCNIDCWADLEGGCAAQCEAPSGAIFCNGQYVDASDIDACASYILENFSIDIGAELNCDASGCEGTVSVGGCSMSDTESTSSPFGLGALGVGALGLAAIISRRRRRS